MEKMKKWYKSHQKPALIGTIMILLLIGYLAGRIYFNDKFLKGTVINDCSVETLSLKQANQKLEKQVSSKSLTLVFNDGQSEVLQANQLGISYNEKNSLQKVMDQQNKWLWFTGFFSQNKQTLTDLINVNDESLSQGIQSLEHAQADKQVDPTDAYLQYQDKQFSIVKETLGSKFNNEQLINNIKVYISEGKTSLDLTKSKSYVLPTVYEDNQDLKNHLEAANQYCLSSIHYTTPKGTEITLDGGETMNWLTKNEDGTYTKDESAFKSKLNEFVKSLASQYNSIGSSRTFIGQDGQSHTVSGGTYGFRVSQDKEVSALLALMNENKSEESRVPEHTGQLPSEGNGGLGSSYIEVNITKQHLWLV